MNDPRNVLNRLPNYVGKGIENGREFYILRGAFGELVIISGENLRAEIREERTKNNGLSSDTNKN